MNENLLFCCCFQAVLLLFSNLLRCFSRILTNSEIFQIFFRIFSELSENFLKKIWQICESRNFLLPAIQKWMKTSCFVAIVKLFALLFSNFDEFQNFFQNFFRKFSEISDFWKKSEKFTEKFVNPEIFCCQRFKNEWKLAVLLLFSKFSASFSYFWQFPGTKSGGKLAVLLLLSNFLRCFSRILTNFRFFSEIFNFFKNFSDFFQNFLKKIDKILKSFWIFS